MRSFLRKGAIALVAAVVLALGVGLPANAASVKIVCSGTLQYPHLSSGAGGAIAKIDIKCTGSGATHAQVRVRGLLSFAASKSKTDTKVTFVKRGESNQTQKVAVNGGKVTYYIPQVGKNGGHGAGFWRVTATWQIVSPGTGTVGSDTATIWKTI